MIVISDLEEQAPVWSAHPVTSCRMFDFITECYFHELQIFVPLACPNKFIYALFKVGSSHGRNLDLEVFVDLRDGKLVELSSTHRTLSIPIEYFQVASKAEKVFAGHAHWLSAEFVADRTRIFLLLGVVYSIAFSAQSCTSASLFFLEWHLK